MYESMNMMPPGGEENRKQERVDGITAEQWERYQAWIAANPEEAIDPEQLATCEVEIEKLFVRFGNEHSLEALHAITDLTPQEAPFNAIREAARADLKPIVRLLWITKVKFGEHSAEYKEIRARYAVFSQAVGIINKNKVDHAR